MATPKNKELKKKQKKLERDSENSKAPLLRPICSHWRFHDKGLAK
jgi:hypothetical protein